MTHRNHQLMLKNAHNAIPDFDEPALPFTQIHQRQASPKLPTDELRELLESHIAEKNVEVFKEHNKANGRMVDVYRFLRS